VIEAAEPKPAPSTAVEDVDTVVVENETFDVVVIGIEAVEPSEHVSSEDDYVFVDDVDADDAVHVDNVSGDD
jgi:hypothetical protein